MDAGIQDVEIPRRFLVEAVDAVAELRGGDPARPPLGEGRLQACEFRAELAIGRETSELTERRTLRTGEAFRIHVAG
jgi:hypothetical protein